MLHSLRQRKFRLLPQPISARSAPLAAYFGHFDSRLRVDDRG